MAAPLRITPEMAEIIAQCRRSTHNVSALHRALKARGIHLNRRTLDRYLAGAGAYAAAGAPRAAVGPAAPPEAPDLSGAVAEGEAAIAGDADLQELERVAAVVRRAMARWEPQLGNEGTAVRAYRGLADTYGALLSRMAELRPRQDVEREAILDAGSAERDVLIERARRAARADDGIRGKYERARALLERKFRGES